MIKFSMITALLLLVGCTVSSQQVPIGKILIPKNVDWKDGSFSTYIFTNDTTVIIIKSTQKYIRDSIYFQAEPGFNILKGTVKQRLGNVYIIKSRYVYRYFKLPGETGSEIHKDTLKVDQTRSLQKIRINQKEYIPGARYTQKSKKTIWDIATEMVPKVEKHPEEYN